MGETTTYLEPQRQWGGGKVVGFLREALHTTVRSDDTVVIPKAANFSLKSAWPFDLGKMVHRQIASGGGETHRGL